ncbi:hypothetical protein ARMSODRAFT_940993 [Armillaria solidipes]|uniref:Gti1/Pac2 family-domain-containing protein n=1 Tax=Armillaria solidipes TaxID=1076256 RepID=A0A2H3B4V9_9AGAR|nr:hypothetical protein ARMSODRAFT_940993 [Armillaria solidipes]
MSQSSSAWTEPPWSGWIETTGDALLILEAARRGLIPRVTRRLVDAERKMITSGSVFVFDEDESGIKRWTDGFFWSPSRILGNFLLYRETDKRGPSHRGRGDEQQQEAEDFSTENPANRRPRTDGRLLSVAKHRERSLVGSLTNSYKFKPDGLMKKTFSLNIGGVAQHLISYYKVEDVENGRLRSPSSLPELASLDISPEYLDKTHFRNPPKVEIGADGIPRYRGDADDIDTSPTLSPTSIAGLPLLSDAHILEGNKRSSKRYDPYGSPPVSKRRKLSKTEEPAPSEQPPEPSTPTASVPVAAPVPVATPFPDPNGPAAAAAILPGHHLPPYPYNFYQIPHPPVYYPAPVNGVSPPPPPQSPPYPAPYMPYSPPAIIPADPTQPGVPPQPQYYSYYPPPGYPPYPGMWPAYPGYPMPPPPQMVQQQQSESAAEQGQQEQPQQQQQQVAV